MEKLSGAAERCDSTGENDTFGIIHVVQEQQRSGGASKTMACGTSRVAQRVVTVVMRAWARHHELTERGRGFDQPSRST